MGLLWLQAFGKNEVALIEEISKELKAPVEVVAKHYKEMKEAIQNEIKD